MQHKSNPKRSGKSSVFFIVFLLLIVTCQTRSFSQESMRFPFSIDRFEFAPNSSSNLPVLHKYDLENDFPSFFSLDIPYFSQETGESGGVAALRMALGHYGWCIDESELIRVARTSYLWWNTGTNGWDLLRAAHFSNSSTSFHDSTLHGYTNKWSGIDSVAGVITDAYSSENRSRVLEVIKKLLLEDKVTIFTMWYAGDQDFVRQFRVLVGYDDRTDELIFADPWDNPSWRTSYDHLFDYWWRNGGQPAYWVQGLFPWEITLDATQDIESRIVSVTATIETGVPEWWRTWPDFETWKEVSAVERCYIENTSISIEVPDGYTIDSGDISTEFVFDSRGHATVCWELAFPDSIEESASIYTSVIGNINGKSPTYGVYTDTISSEQRLSLWDSSIPQLGELEIACVNLNGVDLEIEIDDQSPICSAELLWRSDVSNWTSCKLEGSGSTLWRTTSAIPRPLSNLTQFQVVVEDLYNNSAQSAIYELDWNQVNCSPPQNTNFIDLSILFTVTIGAPCILILVSLYMKHRRRETS